MISAKMMGDKRNHTKMISVEVFHFLFTDSEWM